MPSLFFEDKFNREIPITGLLMEYLGEYAKKEQGLTAENFALCVSEGLVQCGLVKEAPTPEQIIWVVTRINAISKESAEEKAGRPEEGRSGAGRHFSGYLSDWVSKLDYVSLCLFVADYDYLKAREYYETIDQQSLTEVARGKTELEFEKARVTFEASLFGFGGGYRDSPREGVTEIDLEYGGESANRSAQNLMKEFF